MKDFTGRGDVAVFIDFENIYISVRNRYDANPNFESIMELAQRYGRVTLARAYADWYRYPRVTNALYANAIEPMYVPTYYYDRDEGRVGRAIKNSVDMHLCIDMMKTLYSFGNISTYVLVTGDRDFIPLINAVRQQGKQTVVIGVAQATASHLAQAADELIYYNQVLDDAAANQAEVDPFDALVTAVQLARRRDLVATLATTKVLLLEVLPSFDERRAVDATGRPFAKFSDFAREAERRGRVKLLSTGSVTEVLLPDEDPFTASRFAHEPRTPADAQTDDGDELGEPVLTDTDWAVFEEAMRQFSEPMLFIQIYDALRELRNKAIIDLSNRDIKHLIKLAINSGQLVRTTRGPNGYYHLDADRPFIVPTPEMAETISL